MKKIVIAGGSGQIGTLLARHFVREGHAVIILSRRAAAEEQATAPCKMVCWDGGNPGAWSRELQGSDILINLSGRSVDCRYSARHRREIVDSRVQSTNILGKVVSGMDEPPSLWINAGTATIYRHALDRPMNEASGEIGGCEPGVPESWRFSIEVAKRWEEAFFAAVTPRTRKVVLRSAMTMSADKGAVFDVLLQLVRLGLGGRHASGKQFVSWIHEADFVRSIDFLIGHAELSGPINVAAPHPVPNCEFMTTLRQAWGMPFGLPATRWMLEAGALVMRTETELILKSRRVVPARLCSAGFEFQFPEWSGAAADLVKQVRARGHA